MWFPTSAREQLKMLGQMFVWKYGRTMKVLFHIAVGIGIFWWFVHTW